MINLRKIVWCCINDDRIYLEFLLLHFLMMTTALMWISSLHKDCHHIKYVIKSSFSLDFKSILKIFQKYCILKFLLLTPMSFLFINNELFIRTSLKMKWKFKTFSNLEVNFPLFWRNLSYFDFFHSNFCYLL